MINTKREIYPYLAGDSKKYKKLKLSKRFIILQCDAPPGHEPASAMNVLIA